MSVEKSLERAIKLYSVRSENYGEAYLKHGKVMKALFPDGLALVSERSFAAFGILNMMAAKIERFSHNIENGHKDSMEDMIVYAAMMLDVYEKMRGEE